MIVQNLKWRKYAISFFYWKIILRNIKKIADLLLAT